MNVHLYSIIILFPPNWINDSIYYEALEWKFVRAWTKCLCSFHLESSALCVGVHV